MCEEKVQDVDTIDETDLLLLRLQRLIYFMSPSNRLIQLVNCMGNSKTLSRTAYDQDYLESVCSLSEAQQNKLDLFVPLVWNGIEYAYVVRYRDMNDTIMLWTSWEQLGYYKWRRVFDFNLFNNKFYDGFYSLYLKIRPSMMKQLYNLPALRSSSSQLPFDICSKPMQISALSAGATFAIYTAMDIMVSSC
jgi:hypothetical protein